MCNIEISLLTTQVVKLLDFDKFWPKINSEKLRKLELNTETNIYYH